ncbi:hypothetical protein KIN20_029721 [Parelaphostrongylus tenuis]|uniref:EGF-like domain-containing protein n=1 Tax=Parelaphostrongylus tenuis TaxID=148309 RepID=A0AAD5R2T5_PARTN|nr:hypothetical protein KIN20_029721 [Parelaphostrongylus tenuis]
MCACPPEKPIVRGDECSVQQFNGTGAVGELCDENTVCTQGSTCNRDTGVCTCPPGYTLFGAQCLLSPTYSSVIRPVMTPSPLSYMTMFSTQKFLALTTPSDGMFD